MLLSPCFFWMRMQGPSFNSIKVRLNLKYAITLVLGALFQFHIGTIKPKRSQRTRQCQPCFNSIKVRLNLNRRMSKVNEKTWFQFHKGTIKPAHHHANEKCQSKFQFHKGTIKPGYYTFADTNEKGFNSIKVRLNLC